MGIALSGMRFCSVIAFARSQRDIGDKGIWEVESIFMVIQIVSLKSGTNHTIQFLGTYRKLWYSLSNTKVAFMSRNLDDFSRNFGKSVDITAESAVSSSFA